MILIYYLPLATIGIFLIVNLISALDNNKIGCAVVYGIILLLLVTIFV